MQTQRLVLKSRPTPEQLKAAQQRFDWRVVTVQDEDENLMTVELVTADDAVNLFLTFDDVIGVDYFELWGNKVQEVAEQINDAFEVQTTAQILASVKRARSNNGYVDAIYAMCISAPPNLDQDLLQVVQEALSHSDGMVRASTIWGLSYIGWPELIPLVEKINADDPDQEVRDAAAATLASWRAVAEGDAKV